MNDNPGTLFDTYEPEYDSTAEAERRYLEQDWTVECRHCGLKATSPQMNLAKAGWSLTRKGEVCRDCNFDLAFEATIRESIFC